MTPLRRSVLVLVLGLTMVVAPSLAYGAPLTPAEVTGPPAASEPVLAELPADVQDQHVSRAASAESSVADRASVVADRIFELGRDRGLAGQRVDDERGVVDVWWKGAAPPEVVAYATQTPLGVEVRLHPTAAFTRVEAQELAARVAAMVPDDLRGSVAGVAVAHDGTGVRVRAVRSAGLDDVARLVREVGDGVTLEVGEPDEAVTPQSRLDDAPPWKGGIRTSRGCSTAFAVTSGSTGLLLTAHHCDPSADAPVHDGAGERIAPGGATVSSIPTIDSQVIDPTAAPATTGRVYTGAWTSGTTAAVKGWSSNWTGQTVCNNGATSGTRCGRIVSDAVAVPGLAGSFYVQVRRTTGWLSAGGDSGGPWTAATTGGVRARGVHHGGMGTVACGAVAPDVAATCTSQSLFVPVSVVLKRWGVRLETS